jgi:hypothetical protein
MTERKDPEGSTKGPIPTHAAPPPADQSGTQSQRSQPQQSQRTPSTTRTSQSNDEPPDPNGKRMIADHFRSQGKQPEDVIWEFQGIPLRLRDLD